MYTFFGLFPLILNGLAISASTFLKRTDYLRNTPGMLGGLWFHIKDTYCSLSVGDLCYEDQD